MYIYSTGDEVHYVSVKLTVRQAASAPSAALLLASAMLPPQWNNLHVSQSLHYMSSV